MIPGVQKLKAPCVNPSVDPQYAVKHECNNAILPRTWCAGRERAAGAGYIWGVSLIKRAALSAARCIGEKIGERSEGDRCLTVDKRPATGTRARLRKQRACRACVRACVKTPRARNAEGKRETGARQRRRASPTKTVNLPIKLRLTICGRQTRAQSATSMRAKRATTSLFARCSLYLFVALELATARRSCAN